MATSKIIFDKIALALGATDPDKFYIEVYPTLSPKVQHAVSDFAIHADREPSEEAMKLLKEAIADLQFAEIRIALIQSGDEKTYRKVNLKRPNTDNLEGIWCLPKTPEDLAKIDDDHSRDETFRAYLLNMPLPWSGRTWGSEIVARTQGKQRPTASPDDQAVLDNETHRLFCGLKLWEYFQKKEDKSAGQTKPEAPDPSPG